MELDTIGIDLGKTVFHLVGLNQAGEVVVRKKFSRAQLLHFTANLRVRLMGMEACGGAHFLGKALWESTIRQPPFHPSGHACSLLTRTTSGRFWADCRRS